MERRFCIDVCMIERGGETIWLKESGNSLHTSGTILNRNIKIKRSENAEAWPINLFVSVGYVFFFFLFIKFL